MATAPLIVIAGPTASGKTSLAIELARQYGGEIICADSRTLYKGLDIGTAKPTAEERVIVPHWGLDLVEPGEVFTAADFQRYTVAKIADIRARGKIPFLVGGTGLYIDCVIFNYDFGSIIDPYKRQEFEKMTLEALQEYCINNNVKLPENKGNKRYVIRAIEQNGVNNRSRSEPIDNTIIVGIATNRDILRARIERRAEQLFTDGVVKEARILGEMYGWESEAMTGNVYPLVRKYTAGELTFDEMRQRFVVLDWRLAKRQLTWLKRNQYIEWLSIDGARERLSSVLETWR